MVQPTTHCTDRPRDVWFSRGSLGSAALLTRTMMAFSLCVAVSMSSGAWAGSRAQPGARASSRGVASGTSPSGLGPSVHADETFAVKIERGVPYALGVLCDPHPCAPGDKVCDCSRLLRRNM